MSDASEDDKIQVLQDKHGLVGYAVYFKLLEYCARQWDGLSKPEFKINMKHLRIILGLKSKQTEFILSLLSHLELIIVSKTEFHVLLYCPKLASIADAYTDRVSRKYAHSTNTCTDKVSLEVEVEVEVEEEVKEKKKKAPVLSRPEAPYPVLEFYNFGDEAITNLISKVKPSIQENWPKMYPEREWFRVTLYKIINWCNSNPAKTHSRKRWGDFIGKWLDKDWQQKLKAIPSYKSGKVLSLTAADLPD